MAPAAVHLDCVNGAAGDMLLAGLLDAGAGVDAVDAALAACGVAARVGLEEVSRAGLRGALLRIDAAPAQPPRTLRDCLDAVAASALPRRLRERAGAALEALGGAEAALHGVPLDRVHLHELSAVDTIVDVVGVAAALEDLDATVVTVSPLPAGGGTVEGTHGALPLPAPATLHLLAAAGAPLLPGPHGAELVTPTAAALLTTLARFQAPRLRLRRIGHGAGSRDDPRRPNLVRCWVGEPLDAGSAPPVFDDRTVELRTNLDDLTPAAVADLARRCADAGALDVWVVPATMRKGRPGHVLHALVAEGAETGMAALLIDAGATLGVRGTPAARMVAARDVVDADLDGERVRVKRRWSAGRVVDARPELDDVARVAASRGLPLDRVAADLTAAARRLLVDPHDAGAT